MQEEEEAVHTYVVSAKLAHFFAKPFFYFNPLLLPFLAGTVSSSANLTYVSTLYIMHSNLLRYPFWTMYV
jgi:hypothetical protein